MPDFNRGSMQEVSYEEMEKAKALAELEKLVAAWPQKNIYIKRSDGSWNVASAIRLQDDGRYFVNFFDGNTGKISYKGVKKEDLAGWQSEIKSSGAIEEMKLFPIAELRWLLEIFPDQERPVFVRRTNGAFNELEAFRYLGKGQYLVFFSGGNI